MNFYHLFDIIILSIVEGLTEFIPVSSTGHLIFLVDFLKFQAPPGRSFEISIQLGAILAVCVIYFNFLWQTLLKATYDPQARQFIFNIIIAFIPAALFGVVLGHFIKSFLFKTEIVASSLIIGGIAILFIERKIHTLKFDKIHAFPWWISLSIGCAQVIAMIPGVSRSGATILGALLLGVERKTAAEFSFFLAIPTMLGATTYTFYDNWHDLNMSNMYDIIIGLFFSFIAAFIVVKGLLSFVKNYGFTPFGWYRIALGTLMWAWILF
ncbi:MAG: undecaprenyl-diphosphate phosphatase [Alphaproteobacteria bacterium]|nr:undecaprenyl-diphosphate phosphatase [Alphaproteobacteria bacterium]